MTRKATNELLQKAKKQKNDEFYTQLTDIERELQHYESHFKGKVVYCNCDDPLTSNFFRYFVSNFKALGLKKVIASCYKENSRGFFFEYTGTELVDEDPKNANVVYFKGDGDFRSQESIDLLEQSDIVVTNPPFSLFREYVAQLTKYNKLFLIIGNINAVTYKEIFKLIQEGKIWLGVNIARGISGFVVPSHYELYGTETRIDESGNRIVSTNNCLWLTNLDNFMRHKEISLIKSYYRHEHEYPKYDNYDGINVDRVKDIPRDYSGYMGVPITFLHKFDPRQFEIVGSRKGNDGKCLSVNGKCSYFRIIIKKKQTTTE